MDSTLHLRPVLALSAWLLPLGFASAQAPVTRICYEAEDAGTCETGECQNGRSTGYCSTCGPRGYTHAGSRNEHGSWFDDEHDTGPVGSSQKIHHGKAWPPYPRPRENGELSTQCHAARYWPHPYNCWDRSYVKQLEAIQNANGWAYATTLYAYHFNPETNQLNPSGVNHLRWILDSCPPEYRTVYIQATLDSASRVAVVEAEAAAIAGVNSAPIQVRTTHLAGRPAGEVDAIRRSELSSMPRPRVALGNAAGSSTSTGAGGGGGLTN